MPSTLDAESGGLTDDVIARCLKTIMCIASCAYTIEVILSILCCASRNLGHVVYLPEHCLVVYLPEHCLVVYLPEHCLVVYLSVMRLNICVCESQEAFWNLF